MTRTQKGFIILVVVSAGLWGCSQGDSKPGGNHEARLKALEARCAALESECKAIQVSRDAAQKKLAEIEKEKAKLVKELDHYRLIAQECDGLKSLVSVRTSERDAYLSQLEEVRKNVKDIRALLTRVESCMGPAEDATQKTSTSPAPKL
jgi:chromosome segregation ATPase